METQEVVYRLRTAVFLLEGAASMIEHEDIAKKVTDAAIQTITAAAVLLFRDGAVSVTKAE